MFIAQSITSFYNLEQDRLSLVFTDADQKQLMGQLTRQLFKSLLTKLPDWLIEQSTNNAPQSTDQKHKINKILHQMSQQEVNVTYSKTQPEHQMETFLIGSLNFSKTKPKDGGLNITLKFINPDNTKNVTITLKQEQLHKLINEILKQVKNWDLNNPWQNKDTLMISLDQANKVMH